MNFYPRPPRGGRPSRLPQTYTEYIFLSTPSARRATSLTCGTVSKLPISIHALREEGDAVHPARSTGNISNFYPRPPRGGRRAACLEPRQGTPFLSTPSARRATSGCSSTGSSSANFYPRPPRGGRPITVPSEVLGGEFLSTPSARRATFVTVGMEQGVKISIHALREEGDAAGLDRIRRIC